MSKILLTGMTASQASSRADMRSVSFAGLIYRTLTRNGHTVYWIDPSINTVPGDLAQYDHIVIGVAPVTGLGSNRAYGALSMIAHLFDDPRLVLFLDAPNPEQITHSLSAIIRDPDSINKAFYSYRREFDGAKEPSNRLRIYTAIRRLFTEKWPTTIYPKLPWGSDIATASALPELASGAVTGINLDSLVFGRIAEAPDRNPTTWATDNAKSKWVEAINKTIECEIVPLKVQKFSTDPDVNKVIQNSIGVLIAPAKRKRTWWTYRYAQALSGGVPVVTEWREAEVLGSEWTVLAASVEHMSAIRRADLAEYQRSSYIANIPTIEEAIVQLETLIGIKEKSNA